MNDENYRKAYEAAKAEANSILSAVSPNTKNRLVSVLMTHGRSRKGRRASAAIIANDAKERRRALELKEVHARRCGSALGRPWSRVFSGARRVGSRPPFRG